jgi:hypothetical protein
VTPTDLVEYHFTTPFPLYGFQRAGVDELAPLPRTAIYWAPGLGKTPGATYCMLHHKLMGADVIVGITPPSLVRQWSRWLSRIKHKSGKPLDVLMYQGTPAKRASMSLDVEVVLMSIQIFKRDYTRICEELGGKNVHIFVDEAHCLKDVGTQNYKMVRDFAAEQTIQLLTGTPLSNPGDVYAYVKFTAPSVYTSLYMFEQIHVATRDFRNNPETYHHLDLLQSNLLLNADLKTKEQVLTDLPEAIITQIDYDLDPRHYALYKRLAEEKLLLLPDGDKIDATQATALYHALGQIVCQWHHFGQDESLKSACYGLIEDVLDELGDGKLVVFASYRRTNQEIVRRFNCPGIWGDITRKGKEQALDKFLDDPKCRLITLHPVSAGEGIDGLQHVCQDAMYVEPPQAVRHWTQSLSRIHRDGQRLPCNIRMATALGTVQQSRMESLSNKEALVNPIQMTKALLRDALFGGVSVKKPRSRRLAVL